MSTLTYAIGSIFVGFLCEIVDRRYVMLISTLIAGLSLFIVGPSAFLGIPNKTYIIFIGLGLLGVGSSGLSVPIMAEI